MDPRNSGKEGLGGGWSGTPPPRRWGGLSGTPPPPHLHRPKCPFPRSLVSEVPSSFLLKLWGCQKNPDRQPSALCGDKGGVSHRPKGVKDTQGLVSGHRGH